jgi:hypothetical protein
MLLFAAAHVCYRAETRAVTTRRRRKRKRKSPQRSVVV